MTKTPMTNTSATNTRPSVAMIGSHVNLERGAGKVIAQLAHYAQFDYNLTLAATEYDSSVAPEAEFVSLDATVRPQWRRTRYVAKGATRLVEKGEFEVVHSHDTFCFDADLYTAHSSFAGYMRQRRRERGHLFSTASRLYPPHASLLRMSAETLGKPGARVVAVSGSVRAELLREYRIDEADVSVIYNAVDGSRFAEVDARLAREKLADELNADLRGELVLIFVGHEFRRKRLETVIRAMSGANERKQMRLIVAGADDSTSYELLANQLGIGERVHFLGLRGDIPQLLRASDVFVFPTEYEAASLAILEAAASGLVLLTTNTAMAAEVCTDGVDAILLPNISDPSPMRKSLDEICARAELRGRLRHGSLRLAERFTWQQAWEQYREVYEDLRAKKRHRVERLD